MCAIAFAIGAGLAFGADFDVAIERIDLCVVGHRLEVDAVEQRVWRAGGVDINFARVRAAMNHAQAGLARRRRRHQVLHHAQVRGASVARQRKHRVVPAIIQCFGIR